MAYAARHMNRGRSKAHRSTVILAEMGRKLAIADGDTIQLFQEIDMKICAPKLTIGDGLQTDTLLPPDHVQDRAILDGAQFCSRKLPIGEFLSGAQQVGRAQKA